MTTATLNHWHGRNAERIYINNADGESMGYFEIFQPFTREALNQGRGATAEISWHGEDGLASKILDATFSVASLPGKQGWRELREENPDLLAYALRQAATKKTSVTL